MPGLTEVLLAAIIVLLFKGLIKRLAKLAVAIAFAATLGYAYFKGGEQALQLVAIGEIVLLAAYYAAIWWIRRQRSMGTARR